MKTYDMKQHLEDLTPNPEWLKVRAGKFTGSDFYVMLKKGLTRDKMVWEKATEQITKQSCDSDSYISFDMKRGIEQEDTARQAYAFTKGVEVKEVGFIELDDFTGCSPDGLVGDDGIIEIKCPKDTIFVSQVATDTIKPEYEIQIQFNLFVSGRKWCDYIAYNDKFNLFVKRFERDEEMIAKIKDALEQGIAEVKTDMENFYKGGIECLTTDK